MLLKLLLGHDYGVNDVNDPIAAKYVGLDDLSIVDHHGAAIGGDRQKLSVDGFGGRHLHNLSCGDLPSHDVIGQDRNELVFVFRLQ